MIFRLKYFLAVLVIVGGSTRLEAQLSYDLRELVRICADATKNDFSDIREHPPTLRIGDETYQGTAQKTEFGWRLSYTPGNLDETLILQIKVILGNYPIATTGYSTIIQFKTGALVLWPYHMEFRAGNAQSFLDRFKNLLPTYASDVRTVLRADLTELAWVQVEDGTEVRYTAPIRPQEKQTVAIGAGVYRRNRTDPDVILNVVAPSGAKIRVEKNGSVEQVSSAEVWYIPSMNQGRELANLLMSVRWTLGY